MTLPRPTIRALEIDGSWTGDSECPVEFRIVVGVKCHPETKLPLLDLKSDRVELVDVSEPYDTLTFFYHNTAEQQDENGGHSRLLSPYPFSPAQRNCGLMGHDGPRRGHDQQESPTIQASQNVYPSSGSRIGACCTTGKVLRVPFRHRESTADTFNLSLLSGSTHDSENLSGRDSISDFQTSLTCSAGNLKIGEKHRDRVSQATPSPKAGSFLATKKLRKPIPLEERPPWRSPGTGDVNSLGRGRADRSRLQTVERKISRSADGRLLANSDSDRNSAFPRCDLRSTNSDVDLSRARKVQGTTTEKGRSYKPTSSERVSPQSPAGSVVHTQSYGSEEDNILNATERWVERGFTGLGVNLEACESSPHDFGVVAAQESRKWPRSEPIFNRRRNSASLRGGQLASSHTNVSIDDHHVWLSCDTSAVSLVTVILHVKVRMIEYERGGWKADIPGLPAQPDSTGYGRYQISIEDPDISLWNKKDAIKCVNESSSEGQCTIEDLVDGQLRGSFALDSTFSVWLLLLESTHHLTSTSCSIDSTYSMENHNDHCIHRANCVIRPINSVIFWSQYVNVSLRILGGPARRHTHVFLATSPFPVSLKGPVNATNECVLTVHRPTSEWTKPFILEWTSPPVRSDYIICPSVAVVDDVTSQDSYDSDIVAFDHPGIKHVDELTVNGGKSPSQYSNITELRQGLWKARTQNVDSQTLEEVDTSRTRIAARRCVLTVYEILGILVAILIEPLRQFTRLIRSLARGNHRTGLGSIALILLSVQAFSPYPVMQCIFQRFNGVPIVVPSWNSTWTSLLSIAGIPYDQVRKHASERGSTSPSYHLPHSSNSGHELVSSGVSVATSTISPKGPVVDHVKIASGSVQLTQEGHHETDRGETYHASDMEGDRERTKPGMKRDRKTLRDRIDGLLGWQDFLEGENVARYG